MATHNKGRAGHYLLISASPSSEFLFIKPSLVLASKPVLTQSKDSDPIGKYNGFLVTIEDFAQDGNQFLFLYI